jgi:hypothetical protein
VQTHGHVVLLIRPLATRHYPKAMGHRTKTDRVDAALLARLITHEHPRLRAYTSPTANQRKLDRLISTARHNPPSHRHAEDDDFRPNFSQSWISKWSLPRRPSQMTSPVPLCLPAYDRIAGNDWSPQNDRNPCVCITLRPTVIHGMKRREILPVCGIHVRAHRASHDIMQSNNFQNSHNSYQPFIGT